MNRLTKRQSDGSVVAWHPLEYYNYNDFKTVLDRLAYYEDMEEQGRLVVLPFLPNQDVWDYSEFFDGTPYAEYYKLRDSFIGIGVSANGKRTFEYDCFTIDPEQIGKTVFLTREEAEQALKGGAE